MPRRVAVALLAPPLWGPPGVDPQIWREALAEDVLDVLAAMAEVDAAVAVRADEVALLGRVGWPGMRSYVVETLDASTVFAAALADGYDHAVLLATDAPDLPGMMIAKMLRPLTSHPIVVAPAVGGEPGLLALSSVLPPPPWLPAIGLDGHTAQSVRRFAPQPDDVVSAPGWHRMRAPADLSRLDPRLEGWDATRALLTHRP